MSHLLSLALFVGLAATAISSAAGSPPTPAPGSADSPKLLASPSASSALDHCVKLIRIDMSQLKRRNARGKEAGKNPSPDELKAEAEARATALDKIAEAQTKLTLFAKDPKAGTVTTPALTLIKLTHELTSHHQQIFAALDSGKAMNSPEVRALFAKAIPVRDSHAGTVEQLTIVLALLTAGDKAGTASPTPGAPAAAPAADPAPAVAPAPPAAPSTSGITPRKPSSKNDLPPGVTRRQPGQ